jgi:hypothetical protein
MFGSRRAGQMLAAITLTAGGLVAVTAMGAPAGGATLCHYQTSPVSGGRYTVQNNEWDSAAAECVTTDGGADFTVANSQIANPAGGAPGGYPSIFAGCHWGDCTTGGLAASPLPVALIGRYLVSSSWDVSVPSGGSDAYDVAYDIWINQTPTTPGAPDGTEIMVWLRKQGPIQPAGALVASGVRIGGYRYNVWYRPPGSAADIVTYQMTTPRSAVTRLNLGALIGDAQRRGYTRPAWYLIAVEAGFEIWRGGVGLATRSFAVRVAALRNWPPGGPGSPPGAQPYRVAGGAKERVRSG